MPRVFDRNNVILLRIDEDDLNSFLIDMDIGDDGASRYMLEEFAKVVMEVIPECVFANYRNDEINNLNAVGKLRETMLKNELKRWQRMIGKSQECQILFFQKLMIRKQIPQ